MPTQANALALKWHYTVLWHRSPVRTAAWDGLQLQVEGSVDGSEYGHLLASPPTVSLLWAASPLHLITHCVKWLSSIALHCQCCAAGDGWASFCPHRSSAETAHSHWRTWLFYWSSPCPLYCPLRPNYRPDIIRLSPGCRQSKNSAELWPLAVMPLRLSFIILTATTNRLRYQCRVYFIDYMSGWDH